jgi:hypothetical protein
MEGRAAVTLSSENGPSRSRPCQGSRQAASVRQRPSCAPRRPGLPSAAPQSEAGRL